MEVRVKRRILESSVSRSFWPQKKKKVEWVFLQKQIRHRDFQPNADISLSKKASILAETKTENRWQISQIKSWLSKPITVTKSSTNRYASNKLLNPKRVPSDVSLTQIAKKRVEVSVQENIEANKIGGKKEFRRLDAFLESASHIPDFHQMERAQKNFFENWMRLF